MEKELADLRASGATKVSFLDAGCGPGTWLRRLVTRALALGFCGITARGFDVAGAQIRRARFAAGNLSSLPGVHLTFEVADLTGRLPEADDSVDMTLCLYSVLSHLPVASLANVSAEIACYRGTVHNDGASDLQHSNGICRRGREDPAFEAGPCQEPSRDRPQRWAAGRIQLSSVYCARTAELFCKLFRHRRFARA
jgi:SAM-dependent methyltransferase